jgi:hypothetical protein
MILDWIRKNPQLAFILTEIVNITLHDRETKKFACEYVGPAMMQEQYMKYKIAPRMRGAKQED